MLYLTRKGCQFRSKRGNVLKQFEALCADVSEELSVKDAVLDGEVIALDVEGRQDFRVLLVRRGELRYAVFDVLWLNGNDLMGRVANALRAVQRGRELFHPPQQA